MNTISLSEDVQPLSEFRKRSAEFIQRIKEDKQPILLTQHGKSAAVLMDVAEFERMTNKIQLLEEILEAEGQIKRGESYTLEEAKERLEKHKSKWE
ncbi:MAG: type II toxin-antitoxin system Phd/YefM family antitoxin [Balneolaceae bacterium]|nr:type II toxin-antitoxin system Phd/YefM family antitoxin [Balneolaceae bacterium]